MGVGGLVLSRGMCSKRVASFLASGLLLLAFDRCNCSLAVFFHHDSSNAFQSGTHAGHEPGVIVWTTSWGESCKEGRGHGERLEICFNVRITGVP